MSTTEFLYRDTIEQMKSLSFPQLSAVHSFVIELVGDNRFNSPLGITTDEQLWDHIDHSLDQAKNGIGRDADEVINDLLREFAN